MQAELTSVDRQGALGITFTDKPVTAVGGLALFRAFARWIRLARTLQAALAAPLCRTLSTLRPTVFACGLPLGRHGRPPVRRLFRTTPRQQRRSRRRPSGLTSRPRGARALILRRGIAQGPVPLTQHPKALTV